MEIDTLEFDFRRHLLLKNDDKVIYKINFKKLFSPDNMFDGFVEIYLKNTRKCIMDTRKFKINCDIDYVDIHGIYNYDGFIEEATCELCIDRMKKSYKFKKRGDKLYGISIVFTTTEKEEIVFFCL